jgi:hypothetical protein
VTHQVGDEVQWQDPAMFREVGDGTWPHGSPPPPWNPGVVVEGPYTDLVSVDIGGNTVVALPAEYVRSAPRLPLGGAG